MRSQKPVWKGWVIKPWKWYCNLALFSLLTSAVLSISFLLGGGYGRVYVDILGVLSRPVHNVDFGATSTDVSAVDTTPVVSSTVVLSPNTIALVFDLLDSDVSSGMALNTTLEGRRRDLCVVQGWYGSKVLCTIIWSEADHQEDWMLKPWPLQGWVSGVSLYGSVGSWDYAKNNVIPQIQEGVPPPFCPEGYIGCVVPTATPTLVGLPEVIPNDLFYVDFGGATITNTVGFASSLPWETKFVVQGRASVGTLIFGTAFLKNGSSEQGWVYATRLKAFPRNALQLRKLPIIPLPDRGENYSREVAETLPCPAPYPADHAQVSVSSSTPTSVTC